MGNPAVLAALSLVFVCGAALLAAAVTERRRSGLRGRLSAISAAVSATAGQPEAEVSLRREPVHRRAVILPRAIALWLEGMLAATGNRIGIWHLVAAACASVIVVECFTVLVMDLSVPLVFVLTVAAGIAAPLWLVRYMQHRFQQEFVDAFPDALDLIVRAVRAGLPVLSAMGVAADEIPGPVGSEMRRALDEMRLGVDMETALQEAAERTRVADFWFFVVSLTLQRRTGGALAETLSNLSSLIRRRKEIRVKARALTAESRTSTIILASLPIIVAAILFVVSGDNMKIVMQDPRGRFLLGLAVVLLVAGIGTMVGMVRRALR